MLARSTFKRTTIQAAPRTERETRWPTALDVPARASVQQVATELMARPNTVQHRNPRLLALARGMPCLLLIPACCSHRVDTTVACHSNASSHGKAKARKADDQYSVWGCSACHAWLDAGPEPRAAKQAAFLAAHTRQVNAWRQLLSAGGLSAPDKKALQWALDRLGATPVVSLVDAP